MRTIALLLLACGSGGLYAQVHSVMDPLHVESRVSVGAPTVGEPIQVYLQPQAGAGGNFLMGLGNNVYWDGSDWVINTDNTSNGATAILSNYDTSKIQFLVIPSTGGTHRTLTTVQLSAFAQIIAADNAVGIGPQNTSPTATLQVYDARLVPGPTQLRVIGTADQSTVPTPLVQVEDSATNPVFRVTDLGAPKISPVAAQPVCDASHRFEIWTVAGGAGVADTVEICSKDAANAYAWRSLQ